MLQIIQHYLKEKILLTKSQISKIRTKIKDNFKDLKLYDLIEKIKNDIPNLHIVVNDINWKN